MPQAVNLQACMAVATVMIVLWDNTACCDFLTFYVVYTEKFRATSTQCEVQKQLSECVGAGGKAL